MASAPPGPSVLHALDHLRRFHAAPISFMRAVHRRHGDLVRLRVGPQRFYFAFHPDHARRILSENAANYPKSRFVFRRILPVTGPTGLVQLDGERWAKCRRITGQAFRPEALAGYLPPIHAMTESALSELEEAAWNGTPVEIGALMTSLVLRTAGAIFFGVDVAAKAPYLGQAFLEVNRACGMRFRSPLSLPSFLPTARNRRVRNARQALSRFFDELSPSEEAGPYARLLPLLDEARRAGELDDGVRVKDQLLTFLFAGHETTASSLAWTLLVLASRPEVQARMRSEARRWETGRPPTLESLSQLHYIRAVYQEALRLYPPAWILAREVKEEDRLGRHTVRGGAILLLSVRELQRHPDFWSSPDEFVPDRFLGERESRHPFAFIPFGAGTRICSGTTLAMTESCIILAKLLSRFRFERTEARTDDGEALITLHPREGVTLKVACA